jgi:hypothetical protein
MGSGPIDQFVERFIGEGATKLIKMTWINEVEALGWMPENAKNRQVGVLGRYVPN